MASSALGWQRNSLLLPRRLCALLSAFILWLQISESIVAATRAAPTVPWPPSRTDPTTLKCFDDTTRPECRTYKQLEAVLAEKQERQRRDEPLLLNGLLPSIPVPVLVPPSHSVYTSTPSSIAGAQDSTQGVVKTRRASKAPTPIRILVIGDSLSHGREGDWTWRYRLWQWFHASGLAVQFVGPYNGTKNAPIPTPPQPPYVPGDPVPNSTLLITGGYNAAAAQTFRNTVTTHQHAAYFGRWAGDFTTTIQSLVATYNPDYLLSLLGFNDILLGTSPTAVLNSTSQIIALARKAKPNIKFAISDIPGSYRIPTLEYVTNNTLEYNSRLPGVLKSLNTSTSPIALVSLSQSYGCQLDSCPAAYDGIVHPNSLGEWQIAKEFAAALRRTFGLSKKDIVIPVSPARRSTPIPSNVVAQGSPVGVTVTWNAVYGAYGYDVRTRQAGQTDWSQAAVQANRFDSTWTFPGQQFQYQVRTNNGDVISDWSPVVNATAAPQLASPPNNITIASTPDGFSANWLAPTGNYSSTAYLYQILWIDMDTPGAFIGGTGARGQSAGISELNPGHRYATFIASWNANGGGLPGGARPVTVNGGTPAAPSNLSVNATDPTTVQLQWCGDPAAAGYKIWLRNAANNDSLKALDNINSYKTNAVLGYLFPGTWNYEFCVSAINGNTESPIGQCVRAATPNDGPQGGPVGGATCYDGTLPGAGSSVATSATTASTTATFSPTTAATSIDGSSTTDSSLPASTETPSSLAS